MWILCARLIMWYEVNMTWHLILFDFLIKGFLLSCLLRDDTKLNYVYCRLIWAMQIKAMLPALLAALNRGCKSRTIWDVSIRAWLTLRSSHRGYTKKTQTTFKLDYLWGFRSQLPANDNSKLGSIYHWEVMTDMAFATTVIISSDFKRCAPSKHSLTVMLLVFHFYLVPMVTLIETRMRRRLKHTYYLFFLIMNITATQIALCLKTWIPLTTTF